MQLILFNFEIVILEYMKLFLNSSILYKESTTILTHYLPSLMAAYVKNKGLC